MSVCATRMCSRWLRSSAPRSPGRGRRRGARPRAGRRAASRAPVSTTRLPRVPMPRNAPLGGGPQVGTRKEHAPRGDPDERVDDARGPGQQPGDAARRQSASSRQPRGSSTWPRLLVRASAWPSMLRTNPHPLSSRTKSPTSASRRRSPRTARSPPPAASPPASQRTSATPSAGRLTKTPVSGRPTSTSPSRPPRRCAAMERDHAGVARGSRRS